MQTSTRHSLLKNHHSALSAAVVANDRLRYAHHAARALVENSSGTLTEEEIEALLADYSRRA